MRGWFLRFNNKVQQFMYGRYGVDEFGTFLLVSGMIMSVLSLFWPLFWLWLPAFVMIIWSYVRCFSKNFEKRRRELNRFLQIRNKIRAKFSFWRKRHSERKTHRYFKCRLCKTVLRVPKGKGKIEITCPKCKGKVVKKT